jgi:hypothetical protein
VVIRFVRWSEKQLLRSLFSQRGSHLVRHSASKPVTYFFMKSVRESFSQEGSHSARQAVRRAVIQFVIQPVSQLLLHEVRKGVIQSGR